ncbi:MAG: porin [Hyphomicrobiales bacterium]
MTYLKTFRTALLAGAAFAVTAGAAQADELKTSASKLASLPVPIGNQAVSFVPTADLLKPLSSVTVHGYILGRGNYDFDQAFDPTALQKLEKGKKSDNLGMVGRGRLTVKSTNDTAIGQIRTKLEAEFRNGDDFKFRHAWGEWDFAPNLTFGVGQTSRLFALDTGIGAVEADQFGLIDRSRDPQLRLAYAAGPMTFAVALNDATGDASTQIVGVDGEKYEGAHDNLPDLNASLKYKLPGGHDVQLGGVLRNLNIDKAKADGKGPYEDENKLGWGVQGAANVSLGDIAKITASVIYGKGLGNYLIGSGPAAYVVDTAAVAAQSEVKAKPAVGTVGSEGYVPPVDAKAAVDAVDASSKINPIAALGVAAGVTFNLSEATFVNLGWGWTKPNKDDVTDYAKAYYGAGEEKSVTRDITSLTANLFWKPVDQLKLGWEAAYAKRRYYKDASTKESEGSLQVSFGTWFYF